MSEAKAHVAILSLELYLPSSGSLKSKRRVLKSLADRIRSRFNVSFSEISQLDQWQKSICGACMISNDKSYLDSRLQTIVSFLEKERDIEVVDYEIVFM